VIALDTNVLVRFFVNDDTVQAEKAKALFEAHADQDEPIWIADIVLIETVWALDRIYERTRLDISSALRALAGNATVRLESPGCITAAFSLYAQGPAGFADCLLAVKARQAGCDALHGLDRKMLGLPGVEML
jgi:predicted nucleic-acid-binding protein